VSVQRRFERLAWTIGIVLVAVWAVAKIHSKVGSRRDLDRFEEARRARATALPALPTGPSAAAALETAAPTPVPRTLPETKADTALWSKERIKGYEESLAAQAAAPLAILRVPKIGLEVAVLDGTDDVTLNRGVGHIEDTARPGEPGNCGIAGHRDGFFRGLKDVVKGDRIELETLSGTQAYRVDDIWIVKPEDVQVLDPTPQTAITLVACYPFYFVGHAPQRYIVRAVREDAVPAANATR
jgi:sortase A